MGTSHTVPHACMGPTTEQCLAGWPMRIICPPYARLPPKPSGPTAIGLWPEPGPCTVSVGSHTGASPAAPSLTAVVLHRITCTCALRGSPTTAAASSAYSVSAVALPTRPAIQHGRPSLQQWSAVSYSTPPKPADPLATLYMTARAPAPEEGAPTTRRDWPREREAPNMEEVRVSNWLVMTRTASHVRGAPPLCSYMTTDPLFGFPTATLLSLTATAAPKHPVLLSPQAHPAAPSPKGHSSTSTCSQLDPSTEKTTTTGGLPGASVAPVATTTPLPRATRDPKSSGLRVPPLRFDPAGVLRSSDFGRELMYVHSCSSRSIPCSSRHPAAAKAKVFW
mmetsp:Transcript_16225/g.37512  ORF Transcript_16225/g.37512 Transcript_16225/m.37512 type:complete len:336 (+) Transcript_16225:288-1295(+)